jgi:hypothetical protein
MKNILYILGISTVLGLVVIACAVILHSEVKIRKEQNKNIQTQYICGELQHGLTRVILDDSTTLLIYRGVESCSMIQLKSKK